MPKQAQKSKTFDAFLQKTTNTLGWTIARVPFDPGQVWPKMIRQRVRGQINGFAFRTSLFAETGQTGKYFLLVNKAMQRGGKVYEGDTAAFSLEPDMDERPAELPDELASLLDDEPGLREWYDELSEYTRREIGKWITNVKSDESRLRRAEQCAERLLAAKEGEVDLPPVVEAAFRKRPKARVGWAKMTQTQRRNELMAVFYYQAPESRQKRADKLAEAAEKKA